MRAVNLIPTEQRGGAPVGVGRSEGAAYALLGLLAAVALLAVLYGKAHRDISSREAKATSLTAQAQRAQTEATALAPYTSFITLRQQREQAVATLVDSRFDWAHAFHELGRVLTTQTSISSLDGQIQSVPAASSAPAAPTPGSSTGSSSSSASSSSSSSSASSAGASSASAPAPAASAAAAAPASTASASSVSSSTPPGSIPTFNMSGCATTQSAVAQMLQRLRLIDGVDGVALQSSTKGGAAGGSGGGSCPSGDVSFVVGITFSPLPSAAASEAATKPGAKAVSNSGGKAG